MSQALRLTERHPIKTGRRPASGDSGWGDRIAAMMSGPIGLALSITATLVIGITQAQAGNLDHPPPSAAETKAEPGVPALSPLPTINAIGPATDIAVFLKPGVPVELTRAALRQAWTSDPMIRDFVGLSEDVVEPRR